MLTADERVVRISTLLHGHGGVGERVVRIATLLHGHGGVGWRGAGAGGELRYTLTQTQYTSKFVLNTLHNIFSSSVTST